MSLSWGRNVFKLGANVLGAKRPGEKRPGAPETSWGRNDRGCQKRLGGETTGYPVELPPKIQEKAFQVL